MRIDDDTRDQRLSLELTPLIDIIFILVLFFAVTTSLTKPKELDDLRIELSSLNSDNQKLMAALRQSSTLADEQTRLIKNLKDNYNTLNDDYARVLVTAKEQSQKYGTRLEAAESEILQLRQSVAILEQSRSDLQQKLVDQTSSSREVQQQNQELAAELGPQLDEVGRLTQALADLELKNNKLERMLSEKVLQNQKMTRTTASLSQAHQDLQQKFADETARTHEARQQHQKLAARLEAQQDHADQMTQTIAELELEINQLQQTLREKTQQNQKMTRTMASLSQGHQDLQQALTDEAARNREIQQQYQKLATDLRTQQEKSVQLSNTITILEQEQGNLQLRLADRIARSREVVQHNEKLETDLRDQTDKSGRLTNTIAALLDDIENLKQADRDKTAQNQTLDRLLVKARQNNQILSNELNRFRLNKEDRESNEKLLRNKISELEAQLVEFREIRKSQMEREESLNQAQENLDAGLKTHLKNNQLGIQRKPQSLILQLPDQILFDSGSAEVKPEGRAVLRKVGQILKTDLDRMLIQIGGHTDNVPLNAARGSLFPSNWELSAARAVNVVHYFESVLGIDPKRMSAVGYAEHQPTASNATPEGRARNRRIEIVVVQP